MGRCSKKKHTNYGRKRRREWYGRSHNESNENSANEFVVEDDHEIISVYLEDAASESGNSNQDAKFHWEGFRLIDLEFFWQNLLKLNEHCRALGCSISNLIPIKEKHRGFISTIYFKCNMCNVSLSLLTSNDTSDDNINLNAVVGTIAGGSGYSQLQEFSATCNLPCMASDTYIALQNKIGAAWAEAASSSMKAAAEEEISAAKENNEIDTDGKPLLTVVVDGCWAKRSYRNKYNSNSGAASIIGYYSKKILWMDVKNKFCLVCARSAAKSIEPRDHECSANFKGPSTAMESAIITEGFKKSEELYGARYHKFIGDGDSSVYKKLLESRPYTNLHIKKIECRNHLFRNFRGKLLELARNTKYDLKSRKILSKDSQRIIIGVKKAIGYYKSQDWLLHKKIEKLRSDILNAPFHVFGDHTSCAEYFCDKNSDTENKVTTLGQGGIFEQLELLCINLARHSESLIYDVDSNIVEQYHALVAKFVGGKRVNYTHRRSYEYRCSAAAVQHNTGEAVSMLYTKGLGHEANKRVHRLEGKRIKNNIKRVQNKPRKRKTNAQGKDAHYGTESCQKPDLSAEIFEQEKTKLLKNLKVNCANRVEIEQQTREQAGCTRWHEVRRNLITASNFARICKRRSAKFSNIVKQILYTDISQIASANYGRENEEKAIRQLERQCQIKVQKCGLFLSEEYEFLGATPDGVIGLDGLVEIKCPSAAAGLEVNDAILSGVIKIWDVDKKNRTILEMRKNHPYYFQVQGQLNITKRNYCLFAVWTSDNLPLKVEKIYRDEKMWNNMVPKLHAFYFNHLLSEIIDPRCSRNMPIRE